MGEPGAARVAAGLPRIAAGACGCGPAAADEVGSFDLARLTRDLPLSRDDHGEVNQLGEQFGGQVPCLEFGGALPILGCRAG